MAVFNLGRTRGGMGRRERVLMKRLPGRASHATALKMLEEKSETKSKWEAGKGRNSGLLIL